MQLQGINSCLLSLLSFLIDKYILKGNLVYINLEKGETVMKKLAIFEQAIPCPAGGPSVARPQATFMAYWKNGGMGNWSNSTCSWKNGSDGWSNSTASWKNSGSQWSNSSCSWKNGGSTHWTNSTATWKNGGDGWSNSSSSGK